MSIELQPSHQLAFKRPLTVAIKENLLIYNPTQLPIAFKVKTTAPKQYCVRPNSGRIEPGQELKVQVQMQAMKEEPPIDFKCRDKFLVQSVAITAEREQLSPAELWPTMEREAKDQIQERKIRCVFLLAGSPDPQASSDEKSHAPHPVTATLPTAIAPQFVPEPTTTLASADADPEDYVLLKRELGSARETITTLQTTIDRLQQEASTLRQRKPESTPASVVSGARLLPSQAPEGLYPISYVAGVAVVAFLFAYLFF